MICVDSALHLLPQREATQLICLTIYVGTTQLSTTKRGKISLVNYPQDSSSAA